MTYEQYIRSDAWRRLRAEAIERDGGRCRACDGSEGLEVHHRRYPPQGHWGRDHLDALTTLCLGCHEAITSRLRMKRQSERAVWEVPDTRRSVPLGIEVSRERVSDPELPDHRHRAPAHAQWQAG